MELLLLANVCGNNITRTKASVFIKMRWLISFPPPPHFVAITCPPLSVPANVDRIEYSSSPSTNYALGTTATYVCINGFSVSAGDEIRTCSGDGSNSVGDWSGSEPTCSGTHITLKLIHKYNS